jgi:hypothetical protein
MSAELSDYLNSINQTKEHLGDDAMKKYPAYIVNRCLSGHIDAILFANEMNKMAHLDNRLQYDFFINTLRKRKRFSPWLKKEQITDLDLVKRHYGYSNEKAKIALTLLTEEQLEFIRSRHEMGGRK